MNIPAELQSLAEWAKRPGLEKCEVSAEALRYLLNCEAASLTAPVVPRVVTAERVEQWAARFARVEERPDLDYEWAGHVRALLADLGITVADKEPTP